MATFRQITENQVVIRIVIRIVIRTVKYSNGTSHESRLAPGSTRRWIYRITKTVTGTL